MLKKALETNIGQSPPIDKHCQTTIQIDALEYEINCILTKSWKTGIDIVDLQAKIVLRDPLIENLKSENLRCNCKSKQFTRTVDENSNPICGGCGKII